MLFLHGASRTPSLLSFLFTPLLLSLFLPVSPHLPVYQRVVTFLGLSPPSLNYVCKCLKWNVQDYKGSQVQPSLSIQIPYFWIRLLVNIYLQSPNEYSRAFALTGRCAHFQSSKRLDWPSGHLSAQVRRGNAAFLLQLSLCVQTAFPQSIQCHIFHISVLFVVISLSQRAPKHSPKVLASILKWRKAAMCHN